MELDRVLYIFGSFSRRRQDSKRKSLEPTSLSAGSSPLHLQSKSTNYSRPSSAVQSNELAIPPRTSAYDAKETKMVVKEWECGLCKKQLTEPRLLGCLHHFCTGCLQDLHHEGELDAWSETDVANGCNQCVQDESRSGDGSGASGYESDLRNHSGSDASWSSEHRDKPHKYGIFTRKISGKSVRLLLCPTCGHETHLPLGGIAALPLNSILMRKMAAVHDEDTTSVLCDLCTTDTKAESRCSQCLVSVCETCSETHSRQRATKRHSLHPLHERSSMHYCKLHPRAELSVYCATCQEVVCRECCLLSHMGHALANASRAAAERCRLLRDACERAKHVPDAVDRLTRTLHDHAHEADHAASLVEAEVCEWRQRYRRAVEAHGRALSSAAARARAAHRHRVAGRDRQLRDRLDHAQTALHFAQEVLSEGREEEVLSLSTAALRRLERVCELEPLSEPPTCELRFAPDCPAPQTASAGQLPLVGRLLTHAPDHGKCVLQTDGLQDLRVGHDHEVVLELRDSSGDRIWCGGEQVACFLRRRDSSARPDAAKVVDRGDGSYAITVTPPKPGAYLMAVTVNNKPVKGSPFVCGARVSRDHTGQFHCCAFCSSGGQRDTRCGCGGTMSGGYKGCGHGHAGHPGAHHWSCCGSTARTGNCVRTSHHTYQFSL